MAQDSKDAFEKASLGAQNKAYDLIAKLEAADFDTLGHVIVNKIRSIEGVVDTKTLTGTKF